MERQALVKILVKTVKQTQFQSLSLAAGNQTKNIALQLSQLIKFNALKRKRDQKVVNVRHWSSQITALPVYTGLLLHSRTREKSVIDKVSALGLSISYNRVDEIQSAITDQARQEYQTKGLVRPIQLADSVFTTVTIDNVDHNASSSTSKNHFYGKSISFFQHLDLPAANHQILFDLSSKALGGQRDFKLPSYYTEIPSVREVKSHFPTKTINSGKTKLQAHPV